MTVLKSILAKKLLRVPNRTGVGICFEELIPHITRAPLLTVIAGLLISCGSVFADDHKTVDALRIAVFQADATPPLGSPVAYAPARKIDDPLLARGIVILGAGKPIVLCAVDWIGIANGGHDAWREALAEAAKTTPDRVAVHTLHQHDAPRCDFSAEEWMAAYGLRGERFDVTFARKTIAAAADALRVAMPKAQTVTHVGVGEGRVEKVASNRLIPGPTGTLMRRMSASRNPDAQAAPEGVIDPVLKLISFWNEATPIVCLTYYATHPQCAGSPIFVPSVLGRKWSPFFDSTDSTTQLHHAHLSDRSGCDRLQTSTKDSLVQHSGDDAPTARRATAPGARRVPFSKNHGVRSRERLGDCAVFPKSTPKPLNRRQAKSRWISAPAQETNSSEIAWRDMSGIFSQ